jgi:hypothetical protein
VTLADLHELAIAWCPLEARREDLLRIERDWAPAHELAHALIEPRWRWERGYYARCSLGFCECGGHRDECTVYEAAAMMISHRLVQAAGAPDLADKEVQNTNDYDMIDDHHWEQAKALLKRRTLWPVPRTRRSLERALKRRLRIPRGGPLPPPLNMRL